MKDREGFSTVLWFDDQAHEAAEYYVSVFARRHPASSHIDSVDKFDTDVEMAARKAGDVMVVNYTLNGHRFVNLNGGKSEMAKHNHAVSFEIICESQDEVDYYVEQLSAVPEAEQCGWVCDKWGISWQIVPRAFHELMRSANAGKRKKVFEAMLQMKKFDVAAIQKAAE